jgi:hypothetical protein
MKRNLLLLAALICLVLAGCPGRNDTGITCTEARHGPLTTCWIKKARAFFLIRTTRER